MELSGAQYRDEQSVEQRIIADHIRSITFAIADGIPPANDGAGYVVKMLIRRASRQAYLLGLREPVLHELSGVVIDIMGDAYPELGSSRTHPPGGARRGRAVPADARGWYRTGRQPAVRPDGSELPGELAFDLWQTYGFRLIRREMAAERGFTVDRAVMNARGTGPGS